MGDLFAIRIAGNIVTPLELGSIEFAAIKFGPRLVVVLGHTNCGAVCETVETIEKNTDRSSLSKGMQTIVEHIGESVDLSCSKSRDAIIQQTIEANIQNSVRRIRNGSAVLEDLIANKGVEVIGALYDLDTGQVEFYQ